MKILTILTSLMLVLLIFLPSPHVKASEVIDGNKVYIDDEHVYLSAEPHTLGSAGWVTFQMNQKQSSVNIDIALGFNINSTRPTRLQLWANYTHEKIVYVPFTQMILSNLSGHYEWINITNWNRTIQNISYFDWKDININPDIYYYNYSGMNRWYIIQDIPMQQNKLYTARVYFSMPFAALNRITGAYIFAVKPHSLTIPESIAAGYFYMLDPWWNSLWLYRQLVFINNTAISATLQNFPVGITINQSIRENCSSAIGADIRFVNADNTTVLNYEIENWSLGIVWVNITKVYSNTPTPFYIYYNNSVATDAQNPTGVWSFGYAAVYHCNDSSLIWDSTANHYSSTAIKGTAPINISAKWGTGINCNPGLGGGYLFGDVLDVGIGLFNIECWANPGANAFQSGTIFLISKYTGAPGYAFYTSDVAVRGFFFELWDGTNDLLKGTDNIAVIANTSWRFNNIRRTTALAVDISTDETWFNGGATAAMGTMNNSVNFAIGTKEDGTQMYSGYIDEVRITIGAYRNDSWSNATFKNYNQSTFFIYKGRETYSIAESVNITVGYLFNGTTDVCPCCVSLGVNVTSSIGHNVDIYIILNNNNTQAFPFSTNVNITNVSTNTTYYFEMGSLPLYNYTYHWWATIFLTIDQTSTNISDVYYFNTTNIPCAGGGGSSYSWTNYTTNYTNYTNYSWSNFTNTTNMTDYVIGTGGDIGIIGVIGLLGILGYIAVRRRRRRT